MRGTPLTRRLAIGVAATLGLLVLVLLFVPVEGFQGGMSHDTAWKAPWRPRVETAGIEVVQPNAAAWTMDSRIRERIISV